MGLCNDMGCRRKIPVIGEAQIRSLVKKLRAGCENHLKLVMDNTLRLCKASPSIHLASQASCPARY